MPGFILDAGATIMCPHGGQVTVVPRATRASLGGQPPLLVDDVATIAGCPFNIAGRAVALPARAVADAGDAGHDRIVARPALELRRPLPEHRRRAAGHGDRHRFPDEGAGSVRSARHPYRLIEARRLEEVDTEQHIDDLVRIVLLTGPGERLHRPDFGAGLGAATLFEPLDDPLASIVEVRARGSLDRALGDRIEVLEVKVGRSGESDAAGRDHLPAARLGQPLAGGGGA